MPNFYAAARKIAIPLFLTVAGSAHAESTIRLVVTDDACNAIIYDERAGDAAYQGGVDVLGRPVVPADVDGSAFRVPMPITFDVTIDIAERLGLGDEVDALLNVAQVTERDGAILINGQPVNALGRSVTRTACLNR